ncbi:MAG: hypothetical protein XD36_2951 [Halomonas sp. 54_146]|nr:hypothetical protein [Halomonas sp. 54_146]KUJ86609.1 MAG: hypothetical protein XD36_2951 [Halomonas sp. 54_146]|tara:strand:+ start:249 stop:608 length:360 start_codon:yes stop_codon:yes gene_type:complete
MAISQKVLPNPVINSSQPIIAWWNEYLLKSSLPMAKIHLAWLESVSQSIQMEAKLLQAIAESSEKFTQCFIESGTNPSSADIHECYQDMVQTLTDSHFNRLEKVAQLSHEFRRCLWEEI